MEIGEGVNGRWEDVVEPVIVDDIWAVLGAFHMLSLRVFTAAVNSVLGAINIAFVTHGIFPMSDAEVQLRCRRRYMCEKRRSTKEATQKKGPAGVVTRTPDLTKKGKKLGPIRCQSSENLDLRSFTLFCDIDPSAMAGRIQVTAYHCTIGSSHGI